MDNPRLVGHIVSVQGFRVKVELLPETRSALRATLDGVQAAIAINAYLTFSLGAGETVIGIITDLEARETFDPGSGDDLNLELMKPRRVASVQLLGTIEHKDEEGNVTVTLELLHEDPLLSVPLLVADDLDDVAADWRAWAEAYKLPMLLIEADGEARTLEESRGSAIRTLPPHERRKGRASNRRRPRFLARRRAGDLGLRLVIDGEELIAADC